MPSIQDQLDAAGTIPVSEPNAKYVLLHRTDRYEDAQAVVDRLSDRGFEVHHTAIVGEGLKAVERVTGRLDWFKALVEGAINGLGTGLLIGLLLALFAMGQPDITPATVITVAVLAGVIIGGLFRLFSYLATRGKRDFTSIQSLAASQYSVLCHEEHASRARELIGDMNLQ